MSMFHGDLECDTKLHKAQYWAVVWLVSASAHMAMFRWLSPWMCKRLYETYRKGDADLRWDWDSRIVSNLHALVVVVWGAYLYATLELFGDPHPYHAHDQIDALVSWSTGYFIYDTIGMSMVLKRNPSYDTFAHHIFCLLTFPWSVVHCGSLLPFGAMITEATTPLINNHFFLTWSKLTLSKRFTANGLAMMIGFLTLRVPMSVYFIVLMYRWQTPLAGLDWVTWTLFYLGVSAMTTLNVLWTDRLLRGVLGALLGGKTIGEEDAARRKKQQ